VEVVASLSQGRTAAAQCGLFTHKSVPVIFEPPCNLLSDLNIWEDNIKAGLMDAVQEDVYWMDSTRERLDDRVLHTITRFMDFIALCSSKNTMLEQCIC